MCIATACVERQPAPQNNAPMRTAPVNNSAPAVGGGGGAVPSGQFEFNRNPVLGLMKNVGISQEQAKQLLDIRMGYVTQMAAFPKLANGRFDLEKVKPVMDKMTAELKRFLGPQKFARYQKYNIWNNQQLAARR